MGTTKLGVTPAAASQDLINFYAYVARVAHIELKGHYKFDCTKIRVSEKIQEDIFEYYKAKGLSPVSVGMLWLNVGPRAVPDLVDYQVEIDEGFVTEEV